MTTSAKVIAHSISGEGKELFTLQLRYQRFVHSEFMTHRVFSRNASSSRAIPVAKMIEQVRNDPAMPVHWGANQPGMQARQELEGFSLEMTQHQWKLAATRAADSAYVMMELGVHKQVANRVLEPFQWISVVVTATDWDNFFALRDHEDADPNICYLAKAMKTAMSNSKPTLLLEGEWHWPYVTTQERVDYYGKDELLSKVSAARCARVSYLTHDGLTPDIAKDIELFDRLAGGIPLHASPLEHQATPGHTDTGNFNGFTQFRKLWEKQIYVRS